MVSVSKRKRSRIVTKEIGQSKEAFNDEVDSEGTDEEEVDTLVRRRFTEKAQKASKDNFFIQERSKGPGEGSCVTQEVPHVQTLKCTNKEDDVEKVDTVFEQSEGVKIADVEKDIDAQVAEEQPAEQ
nr:hypothetical protein [Tanacetum cinerariifolium]